MATRFYKRSVKGLSLADVHNDVGRRGGLVMRIDQQGDETTVYYEADDRPRPDQADKAYADDAREVSIDEVTKL